MKSIVIKINAYIYYGWVIVMLSGLTLFMSSPGQTYGISVFVKAYQETFSYSSTLISTAYSIATTLSGVMLIFLGKAIDKYSNRRMLIIVGVLLGLTAFYNSFVSNIVMIFFGFFMLRYFGQGSMTLIPSTLIPHWFVKKRALAMSLAGIGGLIATFIIPSVNVMLIQTYGFQMAWRLWSVVLLFGFVPLVVVFAANKPEDFNIPMENDVEGVFKHLSDLDVKQSHTLKEAMQTKSFWFAGFIAMIPSMFTTGLTFHFFQLMALKSISEGEAAFVIGFVAFPAFVIPLLARSVIDRYEVKYILRVTTLMILVSIVFLQMFVFNVFTALVFMLFYGFSIALQNTTTNVLWPNYFGRTHLGSIRSAATVFMVIGSALGPLPFALSFDMTGSYLSSFIFSFVFVFVGFLASFYIKKPVMKTNHTSFYHD